MKRQKSENLFIRQLAHAGRVRLLQAAPDMGVFNSLHSQSTCFDGHEHEAGEAEARVITLFESWSDEMNGKALTFRQETRPELEAIVRQFEAAQERARKMLVKLSGCSQPFYGVMLMSEKVTREGRANNAGGEMPQPDANELIRILSDATSFSIRPALSHLPLPQLTNSMHMQQEISRIVVGATEGKTAESQADIALTVMESMGVDQPSRERVVKWQRKYRSTLVPKTD